MTLKPRTRTYDSSCHDLAELFLADDGKMRTPVNVARLASHIQQTIEDWIAYEREHPGEA